MSDSAERQALVVKAQALGIPGNLDAMGTRSIRDKIKAMEAAKGMGVAKPPTAGEIQERFFTTIGLGGLILGGLLILYTIYVEGDRNALYDASLIFSVVLLVVLLVILGREKKWFQWEKAVARMADMAEARVRPGQVKARREKQQQQKITADVRAAKEAEWAKLSSVMSQLGVPGQAARSRGNSGASDAGDGSGTGAAPSVVEDVDSDLAELERRFAALKLDSGGGSGGGTGGDDDDGLPPPPPTGPVERRVKESRIPVSSGMKKA